MKKSEFKTFDIVTLRNGENYFYYKEVLIPTINPRFPQLYMEFYDNELKRTEPDLNEEKFDIMRVIRFDDVCTVVNLSYFIDKILNDTEHYVKFSTIFERKEVLELTIDDIAKKFNVSPSQIKIKK